MSDTTLRLRAFVESNFVLLISGLLVLALVGGWMTYGAFAAPDTTTHERTLSEWETTGEFTHSATVTEPNAVYDQGTQLENRTVYPTGVAPELDGTYHYSYMASERGGLYGNVTLALTMRSVENTRGDDPPVLWETTEPITTEDLGMVEPGETATVPFTINMSAVEMRLDEIDEQFDTPRSEEELTVTATVVLDGSVNGEPATVRETHTLPLASERGLYRVTEPEQALGEYHAETETVMEPASPSTTQQMGGPLLFLAASGALGALTVLRRRGRFDLTDTEREYLAYLDARSDFDEWVSTVTLPDAAFDRPRAETDTLAALVDIAIDTGSRVIETPAADAYYVLHDGYLYTYTPPQRDAAADTQVAVFDGEVDDEDAADDLPLPDDEVPVSKSE